MIDYGLYLQTPGGDSVRRGWPSNPWAPVAPPQDDPVIVPPTTITVTPTAGGGMADWNDVPASGNFGRYEYQVGTGVSGSVTWGAVVSSGFTSAATITGRPVQLNHLRVRSVTTKGLAGEWSAPVSWTPLAAPVVVDGAARNLAHPFWTTKLAVDAPLASTSADFSKRLDLQWRTRPFVGPDGRPLRASEGGVPQPGMSNIEHYYDVPYNASVSQNSYSMPTYRVPLDQPEQQIFSVKRKYLTSAGFDLDALLAEGVPLPTPSLIPGGRIASTGSDASCIVIRGYEVWEFIGLLSRADAAAAGVNFQRTDLGRYVPDSYDWRCTQAGYIKDYRQHPGWWASPPDLGVSACGQTYLGVTLKWEDWIADEIRHPIGVALPITGSAAGGPTRLLPATRADVGNFTRSANSVADQARIPEGARFRLPPNFDVDGWAAAKGRATSDARQGSDVPTLAKVLRCLRDYGMIINDRAGIIGFSAEGSKSYGTPYGPATTSPVWGNFGIQLPWASFQQVNVAPRDISAYAGDANQPARVGYDYSRMV